MFSIFGGAGQAAVNSYQRRREASSETKGKGFLHSRWSPVTPLSDEEYQAVLQEKLLKLEAEMAIIDDQINDIRAAEAQKTRQDSSGEGSPQST